MTTDLRTTYLGLELRNPLVASASPLTGSLAMLRQLEEAGIAAVVMPSIFEEQLDRDELAIRCLLESDTRRCDEVLGQLLDVDSYNTGPAHYLAQVQQAKKTLSIPVIASLNGTQSGTCAQHARLLEEAGADAVELNLYLVPTDPTVPGAEIEERYLEIVAAVQEALTIPLAVKLGPYFTSLPNVARRLTEEIGVEGLVLFNRYPQPDVDLGTLQAGLHLTLSTVGELHLPLRWIAILRPQLPISLAASTGVETSDDITKLLLVGADAVMTTSSLLRHGPAHVGTLLNGLSSNLERLNHRSVSELKGALCHANSSDHAAFERTSYVRLIATSHPREGQSGADA